VDDLKYASQVERPKYEMIDEIIPPDGEDSTITFNINNLNYVKKKLFDPEIDYLTKKFRE
jgi:hypothetical protein